MKSKQQQNKRKKKKIRNTNTKGKFLFFIIYLFIYFIFFKLERVILVIDCVESQILRFLQDKGRILKFKTKTPSKNKAKA